MRASLHRLVTTIVVGLILVARVSGPGSSLILARPGSGQPGVDPRHGDRRPGASLRGH